MQEQDRRVRAVFDERVIRVYQAFKPSIAAAAVLAGTLVSPFKSERMTWIKPSFLWMMYRCGWATKEGQERVLAIDITRDGFEWALRRSSLSHYDHRYHASPEAWDAELKETGVRVQWDPERDLNHRALEQRSLQLGLSGEAVRLYTQEWIVRIEDITEHCQELHRAHLAGQDISAKLPAEARYALPLDIAEHIGATIDR